MPDLVRRVSGRDEGGGHYGGMLEAVTSAPWSSGHGLVVEAFGALLELSW